MPVSDTDNPLTSRTSHVELPKGDEIMHISNAEEKREPHVDKKDIHYPDFSTILKIYEHFELDPYVFLAPGLPAPEILDKGGEQNNQLVERVLGKDLTPEEVSLLQDAHSYLSEEDDPKASDFIFVFGAKTPLRAMKAVELYKKGLAPKIIFSGRGPFYGKTEDTTEAEQYAAIAREAGVPSEVILVEGLSITIPDNVRRTLNVLDAKGVSYSSFIIVNSPYTQRRGWCTWMKHTAKGTPIYRVNSDTGPNFAPDEWYKNKDGLSVVLGEFVKLRNTIAFYDS